MTVFVIRGPGEAHGSTIIASAASEGDALAMAVNFLREKGYPVSIMDIEEGKITVVEAVPDNYEGIVNFDDGACC